MRVNYVLDDVVIGSGDIDLIPSVGMDVSLMGELKKELKVSRVYFALMSPRSHIGNTFTCLKVELEEYQ